MVPRYNNFEQKWEAMTEKDKPEAGYGPIGSLIRAGPIPFIQRFINAEAYEQGVLKFMATEGCDREVRVCLYVCQYMLICACMPFEHDTMEADLSYL